MQVGTINSHQITWQDTFYQCTLKHNVCSHYAIQPRPTNNYNAIAQVNKMVPLFKKYDTYDHETTMYPFQFGLVLKLGKWFNLPWGIQGLVWPSINIMVWGLSNFRPWLERRDLGNPI